jgi:L-2,4-diaminobutyrate decarboxylase
MFESDFFTSTPESQAAYRRAVDAAVQLLCEGWPAAAYSGKSPASLREILRNELLKEARAPLESVLEQVKGVVANSIAVANPNVAAHLHCPPLIAALAGEVVVSALNQSMDSFDQAPAATMVELQLVRQLCEEAGFPKEADGTFTTGGSQSNYVALLLARDACLSSYLGWNVQSQGLPPEAQRLRILCSDEAHFTVEKSAAQLGLGTKAVIRVKADAQGCMSLAELRRRLAKIKGQGQIPMAIVATAGTTDFGAVDAIGEIASMAREAKAWLHVDAAYGGALLFSRKHRHHLDGIEQADSFSIDFHKLFWQPISCAAFLLGDGTNFRFLEMHSEYLNPEAERDAMPHLVARSLLTTRRFDALKLWVSLKTLGRENLGRMIDRTINLARYAAKEIRSRRKLQLLHEPMLGCVGFRYIPGEASLGSEEISAKIRQKLFDSGRAVIGRTRIHGEHCLKLTLVNPMLSEEQLEQLIGDIENCGEEIEAEFSKLRDKAGAAE